MPRAVIVVNPISGTARRARKVERFAAALSREGVAIEICPTRGPGDGAVRARTAAEAGAEIIVAAGGDGTVNDVAAGLLEARVEGAAMAVFPLGTANLVARHLGVSLRSPEDAARGLSKSPPVQIDVADINGRLMVACAGIGVDADVVRRLSLRRKGHIGKLTYLRPTLAAVREYSWAPFRVHVDDHPPAKGNALLVLNMRPYAAVLTPVPRASATDGQIDVVVLRGSGALRVGRWIARALCGRLLGDPAVTHLRGTAVRIEADTSLPLEIDGDVGGETPVEIRVRPRALSVLRPTKHDARRTP